MSLLGRKGMAPAAVKVRSTPVQFQSASHAADAAHVRGWLTGPGRGQVVGRCWHLPHSVGPHSSGKVSISRSWAGVTSAASGLAPKASAGPTPRRMTPAAPSAAANGPAGHMVSTDCAPERIHEQCVKRGPRCLLPPRTAAMLHPNSPEPHSCPTCLQWRVGRPVGSALPQSPPLLPPGHLSSHQGRTHPIHSTNMAEQQTLVAQKTDI
jgi:hypothetical protein